MKDNIIVEIEGIDGELYSYEIIPFEDDPNSFYINFDVNTSIENRRIKIRFPEDSSI